MPNDPSTARKLALVISGGDFRMAASDSPVKCLQLVSEVRVLWCRCWEINSGCQPGLHAGTDGRQGGHL